MDSLTDDFLVLESAIVVKSLAILHVPIICAKEPGGKWLLIVAQVTGVWYDRSKEECSMRKLLVTGGTVFVSKYVAEYFAKAGDDVYVLNRNNHPQPKGTTLVQADRNQLGEVLKAYHFDAVLDINSYTKEDIKHLLDGLGVFGDYIFISSSAVYPDDGRQPFAEEQPVGANRFWPVYGRDKIEAEQELLQRIPHAYILRPPYLYGPMNDIYQRME